MVCGVEVGLLHGAGIVRASTQTHHVRTVLSSRVLPRGTDVVNVYQAHPAEELVQK